MNKEQQTKEYLLKKMTERWVKDNPELMADLERLSVEIVAFNMKWGTNLKAEDIINTP